MDNFTHDLITLLDVKQIDSLLFQGNCTQIFGSHLFGGQLLGQSLVAAAKTTDRPAHSLHAYFIQAGRTDIPILYQVSVLQDGSSFSRREVKALQNGQLIFIALISFSYFEQGPEFQASPPVYPTPDSLQPEQYHKLRVIEQVPDNHKSIFIRPFQLEIKPTQFLGFKAESKSSSYAEYFRTYDKLTLKIDSVILHQAIMAYYSDYNLLSISLLNHGISYFDDKIKAISLDHIIFFHHDFRVDEWSLYDLSTNISSQAKSLNYGKVWQNNKLVCSTVQECLLRKI
ncbi:MULTISPECIES: acyl-CoA thioesterase [Acinetobacter calcoaceticus/baumannii complex]|uniref:acyl-CoA thioesterase n=1 Tax=Acinetobacter calcoaceticus/baumannii complex TaxID=909768 RepID=UPI000F73BF72|nr:MULTISPECIES: acyl-CoA thioesterase domain-containing protein [Acinetobacter calcoaceticus/baumannii complex]MCU4332479.1 thioesterase family protein [Acinetobacter pittii]RSQ41130.1 acyl-CoA thioesterase II [Acinetobacter baumannii]